MTTNNLGDLIKSLLHDMYMDGWDDGWDSKDTDPVWQRDFLVDIAMKKVYNVMEGDSS